MKFRAKMELIRLVPIFLLLSYSCSIFCHPSRPLNERSTELAWEAWLLVDDQNNNKNNPDTPTRSRITPKSVFIAPTFSPGNLPTCGDGFRPDSTGKCMQIIKLDENAHLEFLLTKLNEKFGSFEYEYEESSEEEMPTPGPFQVNIPLTGGLGISNSEENNSDVAVNNPDIAIGNPDVAIVIAPTKGNFEEDDDASKVKRIEDKPVVENDQGTKLNPAGSVGEEDFIDDLDEGTTVDSRETTTTEIPVTTTPPGEEITTESEIKTTTDLLPITETTTSQETTTELSQQALFFLEDSSRQEENPQSQEEILQLQAEKLKPQENLQTQEEISTKDPPKIQPLHISLGPNKPNFEEIMYDSDSQETFPVKNNQKLRSPDPPPPEAIPMIKFPEEPANIHRKKTPNVEEIEALIREIIYSKPDTKPTEQHIFRHREPPLSQLGPLVDPDVRHKFHNGHDRHPSDYGNPDRIFNHRNRDKWNLPEPNYRETSPYSPIVLKFSNRPHNGRQASQELFHHRHHSDGVYRKVPDDFIFGLKARPHVSHR